MALDKWTIFTSPDRRNTLHVAIQSALWARVPNHLFNVFCGASYRDFGTTEDIIQGAVRDGFHQFSQLSIPSNISNIKDFVYVWNLCRYFRDRANSPESTEMFIQDDIYMARHNRIYVHNYLVLQGYINGFFHVAKTWHNQRFTFAMLSTSTNNSDVKLLGNKIFCFGTLPQLDFRACICTQLGAQLLLDQILFRLTFYKPESSILDVIFNDPLWKPEGVFFSHQPIVNQYVTKFEDNN